MPEQINDILELIRSRRSITKYLPKPIPWEYISRIIDAGRHAPSCGNLQNWKFILIMEASKRKQVAEAALQQHWMITAPLHMIIVAEADKAERYYGVRGERLYTVQNCAAAIENMLLEAHSLGLGACWVGAFDEEMIKGIVRAEKFVRPQAILTFGYPAEIPQKPPKHPINVITYLESWREVVRDPLKYMRDYSLIWKRELEKGKEKLREVGEQLKEKIKGKEQKKPEEHQEHEKHGEFR